MSENDEHLKYQLQQTLGCVTYAGSEAVEPPYCNKAGMDALAANQGEWRHGA